MKMAYEFKGAKDRAITLFCYNSNETANEVTINLNENVEVRTGYMKLSLSLLEEQQ
jgi:hypothetical protein